MRNNIHVILISVLLTMLMPLRSSGQVPDQIISGLKSGDAKTLASQFNDNIELYILDKENICTKAHGEQIMKDFFLRNKPSDFRLTHQGGTDSVYGIGKMTTSGGSYRVYFLLKPRENKPKIVQLRIDKD